MKKNHFITISGGGMDYLMLSFEMYTNKLILKSPMKVGEM